MNRDKSERPDVGTLTGEEVAKHNSADSCWVIGKQRLQSYIHAQAY